LPLLIDESFSSTFAEIDNNEDEIQDLLSVINEDALEDEGKEVVTNS
jgi:hypothetical protein